MNPAKFLYGIIGYPLGHSLSPALHAWAMEQAGHPGAFYAWPTPPDKLAEFLRAVRTLPVHGLSVTIPHKTAVAPFLDGLTPEAADVGAVNTLFWREGELWGHNTDVEGFLAPLRARLGQEIPESALVLGAGGAAQAVLHGLKRLGVTRLLVSARGREHGEALARRFQAEYVPWEERAAGPTRLLVNTTPLGMAGSPGQGQSPLDLNGFAALAPAPPACALAYDLVYNPLETPFLRTARQAGWATQDGLAMLAAQGLAQFKIWSSLPAPQLASALDWLGKFLPETQK